MADNTIHDVLLDLYRRDGALTPAAVVDEARAETSPLHTHFTWDDAEAAEAHRLDQARRLIRLVRVVRDTPSGPRSMRAFVHLDAAPAEAEGTDEGVRTYIPIDVAVADPVTRSIVLARMRQDVDALVRRYKDFQELGEVFAVALSSAT